MIRNDINILIGVKKATMRIAAGCLLLFFLAGNAMAQSGRYVIKKKAESDTDIHYLAHVKNGEGEWVLQDATAFNPETCLWISDNTYTQGGTNKNYYFYDDAIPPVPRFLGAPQFYAGGVLTLSTTQPPTSYLNNPEYQYYFYKWDNGLGRGVQFHGVTQEWCNNPDPVNHPNVHHGWNSSNECWEVYWVSYYEGTWKLSEEHYDLADVPYGAKYHAVSITEHEEEITAIGEDTGLEDLEDFVMEFHASPDYTTHTVIPTIHNYKYSTRPAYTTYVFDGGTHNYYDDGQGGGEMDHGSTTPTAVTSDLNLASQATCSWVLTDAGGYLSIDNVNATSPTITYTTENTDVHETATLTLTVTYRDGSTQTSSATILVKASCHNPTVTSGNSPEVTNWGATVTWTPTAETYVVSWKKDATGASWQSATVNNATSYTITGLDFGSTYYYKVQATCDSNVPTEYSFSTLEDPGLFVSGAVFGGGRMADVGGKTEVVIINCGSIGAVYGGNDIAGSVISAEGSTITLGVDDGGIYASYGTTTAPINIGSVYGGGNGYYAYNGSSFVPAANDFNSYDVQENGHVNAMTQEHEVGEVVWTNTGTEPYTLDFPSIVKTSITVTNDYVKVDSIFGGAKNAFLTTNNGNGSTIIIDGGTVYAVFGGNNFGGTQGYGKHYIEVNGTTTNLAANITNTTTTGYGRDFGIRYLFGGGNKVAGSSTDIHIEGGQLDEVFAGGNAADVYYANVEVNCALGAIPTGTSYTFGNTYTNAINPANYTTPGTIGETTLYSNYAWNGVSGIYNVRNLYGGNNQAEMTRVPTVTLTSGSVGTVYGGGNAGDMMGVATSDGNGGELNINGNDVVYGTHVVLNSNPMLVDYIYGGCRMSNVANSTWVELKKGNVGNVYGGCNISGDVGSTRVNPSAPIIPVTLADQEVLGATYVIAGVGASGNNDDLIVYKNIFAGSNGYYDCSSDGIHYNNDEYFDDPTGQYHDLTIPTHNETNVLITTGVTVKGNVYAGGNLAPVGFDDGKGIDRGYPELVGLASVHMDGGLVKGNVYGGGNMAAIYGSNEVRVSGGKIELGLYGGNDRAGQVAEISNRVFPDTPEYKYATDGVTLLTEEGLGVKTYVRVSGSADIGTVYGGGNGAYPSGSIHYCYDDDEPTQSNTFVDIHINGGAIADGGGHIGTVYGGGNGVTVWGDCVTVFLNVDNPVYNRKHVDTIFGGNNMGNLSVVPDIRLIHGQVGTVYGGCNQGAMIAYGSKTVTFGTYDNVGSYVHLLASYPGVGGSSVTPDAKVTEAIYGGCRMNGVRGEDLEHNTYPTNSLVLVEGGDFSDMTGGIFGGSDISGFVSNWSRVVVNGSTAIVGNVYGGGNGGYYYEEDGTTGTYIVKRTQGGQLLATGVGSAPKCIYSGVDIWSGRVGIDANHIGQVFGGGYGQLTSTDRNVVVNIGAIDAEETDPKPLIYGEIYGGSALGNVNFNSTDSTTVNFFNGKLVGSLYGGGLGYKDAVDPDNDVEAKVKGKVFVNISTEDQNVENCFIDLRNASVFGCNNTNGSPQNDVEVHVWKTAHTATDSAFYIGTPPSSLTYAIDQVFGGGDQANYAPENGSTSSTKKATVYVHGCSNTIRRVFSGGNAAAAVGVTDTIEGGRFDYVFGGGNGEDIAANIGAGGTHLVVSGGKITHLFGGSNEQGVITGPIYTEVNGDNTGCEQHITEFFGGSNMAAINTTSGVYSVLKCGAGTFGEVYGGCNKAHIIGDVTLDIKGGTIQTVYGGSKGEAGEGDTGAANITGKVTLNLEGGHITNAFGGSNVHGNITDTITVNVIDYEEEYCGLELTNVYGGSNHANYSPTPASITSPIVNVIHIADSIKGNVYGGGNEAEVTAYPRVNIGYHASSMPLPEDYRYDTLETFPHAFIKGNVFGGGNLAAVNGNNTINVYNGNIRHKLVGGGNAADVNGDVVVNIMGGNVCTEPTGVNAGVYGGCNQSGTINGAITLNITGDNNTQTTIGTQAALTNHEPVSVHGGGYGAGTHTKGNVTINYGSGGGEGSDCEYPMLYGELYGGSALGTVNDADASPIDTTTITILNGSVKFELDGETQYGGKIFGGGRGQEGDGNEEKGQVNGEIHVNIGGGIGEDAYGKANLKGCYIFGCNNTNGSPQQHVYVDVYQTKHVDGDYVDDEGDLWDNYAIRNVYGGGNVAHYQPTVNPDNKKKVHNRIHNCGNTIEYVYGGGNAANTIGTEVSVDGGRFKYIFGGGNGQVVPANIGMGGVNISIYGGHVGWYFSACNLHGMVAGGTVEQYGCTDTYCPCYPDTLVVEKYYFGANKALTVGGLSHIINCGDNMNFKYVYGGSRLAVVYGDIKLWVRGGTIENLIAGNEGSMEVQADVKKYPAADYDWYTNPDGHPGEVKTYLDEQHALGNDLYGLGGNLQLVLEGGKLGNVYGGNDFRGNVEGNITVIIDSTQAHPCQLDIDYLYAGNHLSGYTPDSLNHQVHLDPNRISPLVYFKNGHVNYDVFGGSEGGDPSHPFGNGLVVSNPKLVIGNPSNSEHKARVGRDLFGGGSAAKLEGNPIVVLQGKTTVGGNVFGGGKSGDIVGGTDVVIDPDSPIDPPATPIPPKHKLFIQTAGPANAGIVSVKYYENNVEHIVHNGDEVPEGSILQIVATPNTGYLFVEWWTDFGHIEHPTYATTTCLMGSKNTTLKATFRSE